MYHLSIKRIILSTLKKKLEIVPSSIPLQKNIHVSIPCPSMVTLILQVKVLNYENDRYIALLMDYFHICLENVRKLSIGKTKHLMLKALADTMGGYLQVYILPLTKHSYYAGNVKYRNARKLFELYEQLKVFLRSNGAGWLNPSKKIKQTKIQAIVITSPKSSLVACDGLITYSACKNTFINFRKVFMGILSNSIANRKFGENSLFCRLEWSRLLGYCNGFIWY